MKTFRTSTLRCLLLAAVLGASAPALRAQPDADAQAYASAMAAYERSHWAESYAVLAQLADRGHAGAARMAAQMHRWGPRLYGMHFEARSEQLAYWRQLVWCHATPQAPACAVTAKAP